VNPLGKLVEMGMRRGEESKMIWGRRGGGNDREGGVPLRVEKVLKIVRHRSKQNWQRRQRVWGEGGGGGNALRGDVEEGEKHELSRGEEWLGGQRYVGAKGWL